MKSVGTLRGRPYLDDASGLVNAPGEENRIGFVRNNQYD
jgi:hypothetical protein